MSGRQRISHSKIFTVETCGEAYRRQYEEGEFSPATLWMARGSAVDRLANRVHQKQLEAKLAVGATRESLIDTLPSLKDAAEMAVTAFEDRVKEEGVTVSADDRWQAGSDEKAIGNIKDSVAVLGAGYVRKVAPLVNPIAVQRKIECKPKGLDFDIVGVLDLVEEGKGGEVVVDTKVPGKAPKKDAAKRSEQLPLYGLLRAADVGKAPAKGILRHVVDAGKFVQVFPQEVDITIGDMRAMLARTEAAVASIKAGIFVPAQSGHWKCSARWCSFFASCRFAIGRDR